MSDRGRTLDRRIPGGVLSIVLIGLFAFAGPLVWRYDHTFQREIVADDPPSLAHPFGTERTGHDVLGQVMRGTQQSLKVGFVAAALTTVIGTLWGAAAGLYRGWVDSILMRIVDVILTVPLMLVVLVLSGRSVSSAWLSVGVAIGLFGWTVTSRFVRGLVLSLREEDYVFAARAAGASDARVVVRHLLPNVMGVVAVNGTLAVAGAVLLEASLSFLGFGIQPPDTSLGLLVESAQGALFTRPWLFYFPGCFLVLICLAVNALGDGLRAQFARSGSSNPALRS